MRMTPCRHCQALSLNQVGSAFPEISHLADDRLLRPLFLNHISLSEVTVMLVWDQNVSRLKVSVDCVPLMEVLQSFTYVGGYHRVHVIKPIRVVNFPQKIIKWADLLLSLKGLEIKINIFQPYWGRWSASRNELDDVLVAKTIQQLSLFHEKLFALFSKIVHVLYNHNTLGLISALVSCHTLPNK